MVGRSTAPPPSTLGGPVLLRDGQAATRNFKVSSQVSGIWKNNALIPKPKFLFFVDFVLPADAPSIGIESGISDTNRFSDTREGIVFQVKQIDKPRLNPRTETMVQYNKKRVVQTRIDYQPMTIAFHDDVGDRVLKFWEKYFAFYYADGEHDTTVDWQEDKVTKDFREGGAGIGWGYKGRFAGDDANSMHFLESIDLYEFYGGEFTRVRFVHPKITTFDHDMNDYADSSGQGIRMTFDYEGVIYDIDRQPLTPELVDKFGFLEEFGEIDFSTPAELTPELGVGRFEITNPDTGITETSSPPNTGVDRVRQAIADQAITETFAGGSALGGSGFSFGTNALAGLGSRVVDLQTLTALNGGNPSDDLIQKQTGIQNTIDNLGTFNLNSVNPILNIQTAPNSGINSTDVSIAASQMQTQIQSREIEVGPGQTQVVDQNILGDFSRSFGAAAVIAQVEGIITSVANRIDSPQSDTSNGEVFVDKFGDGTFQLTDRGSAVSNALRSTNSFLGTRRESTQVNSDSVSVDPTRRGLAAERGNDFGR